jgi:hypothetical protein
MAAAGLSVRFFKVKIRQQLDVPDALPQLDAPLDYGPPIACFPA